MDKQGIDIKQNEQPDEPDKTVKASGEDIVQKPDEPINKETTPDFYTELNKEYKEKGEITKEFRENILKKGASPEFVDDIVSGFDAKAQIEKIEAEKILDDIYTSVGGKEKLETIRNWAASNLSKEEIESVNGITSPALMKMVYGALKQRMEDSEGKLPSYIEGGAKEASANYFKSKAQMFEAIKDPRYAKDPSYRDEVTAKIRLARAQGVNLD